MRKKHRKWKLPATEQYFRFCPLVTKNEFEPSILEILPVLEHSNMQLVLWHPLPETLAIVLQDPEETV